MEQLPLGIRLRAASTFANFQAGANAPLVAALEARASTAGLAPLWLYGPPGAGRTHLLQAACARAGERGRRAGYLPLAMRWPSAEIISGLEQLDLVCLDDVERVAGDAAWERALFGLYNELAERRGNLVISAGAAPAAVPVELKDLASRLAASVVWQLRPLDEAEQGRALQARALALGVELPEDTLLYLQRRLPRDLGALCDALDRLDAAALSRQRRLTVPFVRSVLQLPGD
ncbi:MAG TPA: DnaA regulatory inactivator Hda [Steroidobacteraceae bacterium]|nr:DnaA regulatory inactivator Hda [Steroidobacteraceae bacterium]